MGFSGGGVAIDNETLKENIAGSIYVDEGALQVTKQNGQQAVDILALQADLALTLTDYDEAQVDAFTDADGTDDTVTTGSTTAAFSTDKYINRNDSILATETSGDYLTAWDREEAWMGYRITPSADLTLLYVTKDAVCASTKCRLTNSTGSVLKTVDFSGNVATFNYLLSNGTAYRIECGIDGANFHTQARNKSPALPTRTNITYNAGSRNGGDFLYGMNLASITTTGVTQAAKIRITAPSIKPTATSLWVKYANGSAGEVVTYDINDGSSTESANAQNTKNTYSLSGNMSYLEIQMPSSVLTEIEGYFFMWWP